MEESSFCTLTAIFTANGSGL